MSALVDLLVVLIGLIILWIVVSIPAYIAGKAVTSGRATFGGAMGATLGGAIVYVVVFIGVNFFLGSVIGSSAWVFALLLAFLAWIAVYRAAFDVGWGGGFAIAILSVIILFVMEVVISAVFGVHIPHYFRFPF
jgi:hypothetical protein